MKLLIMKKPKTELKRVIELDESVTKDTIKRYKVSVFDFYNVLNKLTYVNEDIIDLIRNKFNGNGNIKRNRAVVSFYLLNKRTPPSGGPTEKLSNSSADRTTIKVISQSYSKLHELLRKKKASERSDTGFNACYTSLYTSISQVEGRSIVYTAFEVFREMLSPFQSPSQRKHRRNSFQFNEQRYLQT